jgi:cell division protease FtsH
MADDSLSNPSVDDFDAIDIDLIVDPSAERLKLDPALLAMSIMLKRALEAAGTTIEEAGRDGIVILVTLPAEPWPAIARDEWRTRFRNGERYVDGRRIGYQYNAYWVAFLADDEPRSRELLDAAENFAKSVSNGLHCVGFAVAISWLPVDLVYAADLRLTVPTLTSTDVCAISAELCGDVATEALPDDQASLLTPRLLRLAKRRDQTADAYIRKLRQLLAREVTSDQVKVAPSESVRTAPTLDRLHGMDEAVIWGRDLWRDIQGAMSQTLTWGDVDRGCLFSGPSGCGKTLLAQALARTCGIPLVVGSYGQWLGTGGGHQGDLLKSMKKTFAEARACAPCILFIDEVDSFPNRATIKHHHVEWETQVVNALLAEIDGVEGRDGVVLVAACNHPGRLDPALTRSGRLDRHIQIHMPDRAALALILREHLGSDLKDEDLSTAALAATGASGADCERVVRGARRRARSAQREIVMSDLLDEIGGSDDRSDDDLWTAAVHEAGHVVMTCALRPGRLEMVSLQGSASTGGYFTANLSTSRHLRAADLRERLAILMAGRAAEDLLLGIPSSGAGGTSASDLAAATFLTTLADAALGLDENAGLVWRGTPEIHRLPETLDANPALVGRVKEKLDEAYATAHAFLRMRITTVHALATVLAARRVLDGAEAEAIVQNNLDGTGSQP